MYRANLWRKTAAALAVTLVAGCSSSSDPTQDVPTRDRTSVTASAKPTAQPTPEQTTVTSDPPPVDPPPVDPPPVDPPPVDPPPVDPPPVDPAPVDPAPVDPPTAGPHDTLPPLPGRKGEPFDPVKENGEIFKDWPKPTRALVITGNIHGYLEPCGCAGLDRMKGGMSRRHSLVRELREKRGWTLVGLDVGGLAKGSDRQAEMKFDVLFDAMEAAGYHAIGLGTSDLKLRTDPLFSLAAIDPGKPSVLISANVGLLAKPGELTAQIRGVEAAGMKIAITSVLGKEYQKEIHNNDLVKQDPEAALAELVPAMERQADYLVLLAHATMDETLALARKFPAFDLVVTAGGGPTVPGNFRRIDDDGPILIEVGDKGMDAVVLGMYDDARMPLRYQAVPLDSRFPESAEMVTLMGGYQGQLEELGFSELGIPFGDRAPPHPQRQTHGTFVGSKKCMNCHEDSYDVWKRTPHAKAYDTLAKKTKPLRHFDPECLSCHVIGWHPTEYFPYEGGFESYDGNADQGLAATPHLAGVGCESCHGPGSAHVAAEDGTDTALQETLRKAMVITQAESQDFRSGKQHCRACHDGDNSPTFDFKLYWPHVEHYEEE